MIVILSEDTDAVRAIARNQANVHSSMFGPALQAFAPIGALGQKENLFVVAAKATRAPNWAPALGDADSETFWNATQTMQVLDRILPANYGGNVYIAACEVDNPTSSMVFAGDFKTRLLAARRTAGKVFGQTSAALGPLPAPGDQRWVEAKAA